MGIEQICVGIVVIIIVILVFLLEANLIDFCCNDAGENQAMVYRRL